MVARCLTFVSSLFLLFSLACDAAAESAGLMSSLLRTPTSTVATTTMDKKRQKLISRLRMMPLADVTQESVMPLGTSADYVFVPPEVGPEIYIGSIIAVLPFIWASKEFGNRIIVQRQCLVCKGSGLVYVTRQGTSLTRPRKCWSCGGFLPWLGWKMFFFSTFFDIGNGGPLQRPAADYEETNEKIRRGEADYSRKEIQPTTDNTVDGSS
jgi:hypothetical protein